MSFIYLVLIMTSKKRDDDTNAMQFSSGIQGVQGLQAYAPTNTGADSEREKADDL